MGHFLVFYAVDPNQCVNNGQGACIQFRIVRLALKLGTLLIRDIELINFSRRLKSRNIKVFDVNSERYTFANPQSAETFENDIISDWTSPPASSRSAPKPPRKF